MPTIEPRLSMQTLAVLAALMAEKEELSGAQIGRVTKLVSGTLYPILARLEKAKWVESRWEEEEPNVLGRPRRRFYRITGLGARNVQRSFKKLATISGALAWT